MSLIEKVLGSFPSTLQGTITFDVGGSGNYTVGEAVTGSGFSAKVVKWVAATRTLTVKKIVGTPSGTITGGSSSAAWTVATTTQAAVGGVAVNTGGWNLRETNHGITRSIIAGSRTLVEVMLAQSNLFATRTDVGTIPTFALTAITSSGVLDISEADQFTFTITANEAIRVVGVPTFDFTIGATPKTASFVGMTGNVLTFGYTVIGGDESADADFTVAAGNFGLPGGAAIYDIVSGSEVVMTAPIAVSGTSLTQLNQVIVA